MGANSTRPRFLPSARTMHYKDRLVTYHEDFVSGEKIEHNPLFRAVRNNDLSTFKNLLRTDELSVNIQDSRGRSLLNLVIKLKRVEFFDFLLSLEKTDVNYEDCKYGTPLLCVASNFYEDFALKLIEKGADVHRTDNQGNTFLHWAAQKYCNNLAVGKIIIEKGIDINHQASSSNTPLYEACQCRNLEWIHMLLYYGADARISADKGDLPLSRFTNGSSSETDMQLLGEILFNHTFDIGDSVPLKVVLVAMRHQPPSLFSKMLDYIEHVVYDEEDMEDFAKELINVNSKNFKLFFGKFVHIVEELVENYRFFDFAIDRLLNLHNWRYKEEVKEIFETFLKSDCVEDFVQLVLCSSHDSIISIFVELYTRRELTRLTETVCLMLSYGLRVTSADLSAVYNRYGFCELFKILLHMDIETDTFSKEAKHRHSMTAIFYQPQMTIENILERVHLRPTLLSYFNDSKLKEYITVGLRGGENPYFTLPQFWCGTGRSDYIEETTERVKQLPNIPCLVELSRNVTRRYIVERFGVKNSRQFYTVIQRLPISTTHKEIISLERTLY